MRKAALSLLILSLLLAGCVYYNTFYNARKFFQTAQDDALTAKGTPSRSAIQNYNKAMKKCAVVLTDYPDSKWADDAMFMISQCYFYKQKYVQAKEKFQELIGSSPDSEFVPDAHIYIARCDFNMGRHENAYKKLRDFLVTSSSRKYRAQATDLLAQFYLQNQDFTQAEHYYQKIIDNYPQTELYKQAFFSLGILYHKQDKFDLSSQIFQDFLKIKAEKKLKLDARYYILYNYLLADDYQTTLELLPKLMRDEYRLEEISRLNILKARALAQSGETDQADIIFDQIIKENDRTLLAAESFFFRAEMHFRLLNNYQQAIEYYNEVRAQNSSSPYLEDAVSHSAVASQIVQYNSSKADIELKQLISEQMKLAEYYLEVLELPDSAMVVYDNIISYRDTLYSRLDSLQMEYDRHIISEKSDSLAFDIPAKEELTPLLSDSTFFAVDSLSAYPDSASVDSLQIVLVDTTETKSQMPVIKIPTKLDSLSENISVLQGEIELYNLEFIPYVKFVKLWYYQNVYKDSTAAQEYFNDFIKDFPDNKYSYAAQMLRQHKKVEFISFSNKNKLNRLNNALDMIFTNPDSALVILQNFAADTTGTYYQKAVYSLGYLHYHVYKDTTLAKPLFDKVLSWPDKEKWIQEINLVYKDGQFLSYERLPALVEIENRKREEAQRLKEEEAAQDSTAEDMVIELEDIEDKGDNDLPPPGVTPLSPRPKRQ